jgi:hypothetical protein
MVAKASGRAGLACPGSDRRNSSLAGFKKEHFLSTNGSAPFFRNIPKIIKELAEKPDYLPGKEKRRFLVNSEKPR